MSDVIVQCNADTCKWNNKHGICEANSVNLDVQITERGTVDMICLTYEYDEEVL